jgi:hypothetical protein
MRFSRERADSETAFRIARRLQARVTASLREQDLPAELLGHLPNIRLLLPQFLCAVPSLPMSWYIH